MDDLARQAHRTPTLLTDAEAATWGEYISRTPRPGRFVHLHLDTGVACGAVIDGRLQRLDTDREEHLDLLVVDTSPGAKVCPCGRRGCLEMIASGPVMKQQYEYAQLYGNALIDSPRGLEARADRSAISSVSQPETFYTKTDSAVICGRL